VLEKVSILNPTPDICVYKDNVAKQHISVDRYGFRERILRAMDNRGEWRRIHGAVNPRIEDE